MKFLAILAATASLSVSAATGAPLEQGFASALKACEEWVLNPASWTNGTKAFKASVGLSNMDLIESVPEIALPPESMRKANHYWLIRSTPDSGYFLIVSDVQPICHITGGGPTDLQPVVEAVLSSPAFVERWNRIEDFSRDGLISTRYRHRTVKDFEIIISRATFPGQRTDRVQVQATAQLDVGTN